MAIVMGIAVARALAAVLLEPRWLRADAVDVGLRTDSHTYRRVAVRTWGFGGFDEVSLVPGDAGTVVAGHSCVRTVACGGTVVFLVAVPRRPGAARAMIVADVGEVRRALDVELRGAPTR